MRRFRTSFFAVIGTAVLAVGLVGCGLAGEAIERAIEDAAAADGQDVDVEFGDGGVSVDSDGFSVELGTGGEGCMPEYVTTPPGDVMFGQNLRGGDVGEDVEVCVNAWEAASGVDLSQSFRE